MENIKIDFDRDDSEGKNTSLIDISVKSMTNENVKIKESEANKNIGFVKLKFSSCNFWKNFFINIFSFSSILFSLSVVCVFLLLKIVKIEIIAGLGLVILSLVSLVSSVYVHVKSLDLKWYKKPLIKDLIDEFNGKEIDTVNLNILKDLLDL